MLLEHVSHLGRFPDAGHTRFELAPEPYRFLVMKRFPYLIVYNSKRRPPLIMRVIHGARDLPDVLRDLSGEA